jgi:hypothetical protein
MSPPSSGLKSVPSKKPASSLQKENMLHAGFLLGLLFNPEDGSDMFFRNVCGLSTGYMALCPRR